MVEPLPLEPAAPAGVGELAGLLGGLSGDGPGNGGEALDLVRALLDATPARVIVIDADERLSYANDGFFSFTKLHPKQVLGRHISQIIGNDAYASYGEVRARLRRGETVRWEGWTTLAGAGPRYMREHLVPCGTARSADGPGSRPRATVVMGLDMTDLKLREAELSAKVDQLENTEALKSSIVDHALAGIVSTDAEGCIVEFNPAAETMFGYTRQAVLGRPVADLIVPPRHREGHGMGMRRMREGGAPRLMGRRVEMPALRADGSEMPVEMVLWRSTVHGAAHYTASFTDLSERQRAAREIERQREQLRQSEKLTAMGTLLASVAHELNNPLAIVLGRAALLEDKTGPHPGLQADAQRIREAAERCGRIVRTFLNMARQRPGERAPVQLNDLVRAAAEVLGYTLRSHGIRLTLALDEALPSVHADGDQLGQIVLNLLINSQQAMAAAPAGEREVRIETGTEPAPGGPRVWLRVADCGPGVREELRPRLFEPFFTTKPEGVGTGLGLAVSRSIAREHGGDLVLEPDRPGPTRTSGASFRLVLPESGRAVAAPGSAAMPLDAAPAPQQARVLVVDDEPEIAAMVREMLEGAGYEVASAESGAVALAMLAEARFDAIVSDLHMPDIDGATLWREVRAREPLLAQRMLFVTGDTLSPGVRQFLDRARCDALTKPFSKAALLARMQALLSAVGEG
jgi:two-component system NtrC family sensor kinase